jgi:hypothetical protein
MAENRDEEFAKVDVAVVNLRCADGLPGAALA